MRAITIRQIETARKKVFSNAEGLLDDAELLFANGKFPRAYALAHLACEELSKIPMLVRVGLELAMGKAPDWKNFWRRLRDHSEKIDAWHFEDYMASDIQLDNSDVKKYHENLKKTPTLNEAKNISLYTSISSDEIVEPAEVVTKEIAESMLKYSKDRLDRFSESEKVSLEKIETLSQASLDRIKIVLDIASK